MRAQCKAPPQDTCLYGVVNVRKAIVTHTLVGTTLCVWRSTVPHILCNLNWQIWLCATRPLKWQPPPSPSPWGGGELRSAIYRNLPQFFSDASIQKFQFSPLSLLSLGTLYVSVFSSVLHIICVAGRISVFVFPKCHLLLATVILARAKGQ